MRDCFHYLCIPYLAWYMRHIVSISENVCQINSTFIDSEIDLLSANTQRTYWVLTVTGKGAEGWTGDTKGQPGVKCPALSTAIYKALSLELHHMAFKSALWGR